MQTWAGNHVQLRAERWQAAGQASPGVPGRQLGPSWSCEPLPPCSRALTKQEKVFCPQSWLQCPRYSQSNETRLHQTGVCFAGWAGSTGCLQKVFGGDRGCEANDFLASPYQHASLPRNMVRSMSTQVVGAQAVGAL